ncbi:Conserved_hypothetical protein [Hexamita inflata]|uniref:Uncharacterized protein n=1 Tax=Hexamita inflata TaxID=28002 RepID=A0AA86UQU2_9EUKA|nr:Conserved hypothetical protein [Hexamita inflata]
MNMESSSNSQEWQQEFEQRFIEQIKRRTLQNIQTARDAFYEFQNNDDQIKASFWIEMSQTMTINVPHKKLHDYYHNTWSKRFYTDIQSYKYEILNLMDHKIKTDSVKQYVKLIIQNLENKYKHTSFHYNSVYQFVNYRMKNTGKKSSPNKEKPQLMLDDQGSESYQYLADVFE